MSEFDQYAHLATLKRLIDTDATDTLKASISSDYLIKPDVTVGLADAQGAQFLHAAIHASGRFALTARRTFATRAVILIDGHRRGRLPHIVPVTAEPMPTRLASLARGTGGVDALYHVALDELDAAVRGAVAPKQQIDALDELVGHGRLRDLSELAGVLQALLRVTRLAGSVIERLGESEHERHY